MFDKILVPIDFSDASRAALGHARLFAKHFGGHLQLVHVVEHLLYTHPPFWTGETALAEDLHRQSLDNSKKSMDKLVSSIEATEGVHLESQVISGMLPGSIVEHAKEVGAGLMVVSTHGRTGLSRWLMGSVSERLLRSAECPVLVARGGNGTLPTLERVMVATDLSDHSRRAMETAAAVAAKLGAALEVVYAWAAPFYGEGAALHADLFDRIRESAERDLSGFVGASTLPSGVEVVRTVVSGPPTAAICERAREAGADLLVLGTHGRSGFKRMVLGSVAEATVRYAPCATLVVP